MAFRAEGVQTLQEIIGDVDRNRRATTQNDECCERNVIIPESGEPGVRAAVDFRLTGLAVDGPWACIPAAVPLATTWRIMSRT